MGSAWALCVLAAAGSALRAQDSSGLEPPKILSPEAAAVLPATAAAAHISWEAVPGARSYHVRADDATRPDLNAGVGDCPWHTNYLCLNHFKGNSVDLPVRRGHVYLFWVHAVSSGPAGPVAGLQFRVAGEPDRFGDSLLGAWGSLRRAVLDLLDWPRTVRRRWAAYLAPAPLVIQFPAPAQVLASTFTVVEASWRGPPGTASYELRVWDNTDKGARDFHSECGGYYLCMEVWEKSRIEFPVRRGHAYLVWVRPRLEAGAFGGASSTQFSVDGPPVAGPPPGPSEQDAVEAEVQWRLARAPTVVLALAALRASVSSASLGRLSVQRQALLSQAGFLMQRLAELRASVKQALENELLSRGAEATAILLGRARRKGAGKVGKIMDRDFLLNRIDKAGAEVGFELSREERAWDLAEGRRRWWRVFAGAGAMLLAGFGAGAWAWLRPPRESRGAGRLLEAGRGGSGNAVLNGAYRIERVLGQGGMGRVYEAFDLNLKRKVAIKRMSMEASDSEKGPELFLKEAQMVAALKHPNIVQIYDCFEQDGLFFLVFEFVDGRTLAEEKLPLALGRIRLIFGQICLALDYAHERGVIHRDLKPSNIMIGPGGAAMVMDFGIARLLRNPVTQTRGWGTPAYMAPEQELGTISKEADFFALGVCLYEVATGRPPFFGPDLLAQKQGMEFVPPSVLDAGLPSGLDAVVARALEADPALRFHSGAEFFSALEKVPV